MRVAAQLEVFSSMKGRKPKLSSIKELEGNRGKRAIRNVPRADGRPGSAPDYLPDLAREEYTRLIDTCPWIKAADAGVVEAAAVQYWTFRDALARMAATGTTYTAKSGLVKQHPLYQVVSQSHALYLRCITELGATPASRCRVDAGGTQEHDPLMDWIKGN
jgi:P27 family predicted phage terminase small subunit